MTDTTPAPPKNAKLSNLPGYDDSGEHQFQYEAPKLVSSHTDSAPISDSSSFSKISRTYSSRHVENLSEDHIPHKRSIVSELKNRFIALEEPIQIYGNPSLIQERMQFLRKEMDLLEKEMRNLSQEAESVNTPIEDDLRHMQQRLSDMKRGKGQAELSKQLQNLRVAGETKVEGPSPNATQRSLSFEDFESRITKLEKILSVSTSTGALDPAHVENLEETLTTIEQQLDLLNGDTLKSLQAKIKDINHELEQIEDKETDSVSARKINSIYHSIQQWNSFAHEIPRIIDRLYTLKSLHDEEIDFITEFKQLKDKYSSVEDSLRDQKGLLQTVNENFDKNVGIFEENMKQLDERMERILRVARRE